MTELQFKKFENELDDLVSFMTSNTWDFHANPNPSSERIVKTYDSGYYQEDNETYWIEYLNEKVGLIVIHDIDDTIPLFDLRLSSKYRGKGFGAEAVRWITDYIFTLPDEKIRIEAYTRSDNIAMRKTFQKCGFVKEGYLRHAWENDDGSISDSVCYAIIRCDWENKMITPIKINDVPF
ncbi:GNAT family N-acetyltransferase [Paenibacillus sp. GCM10027629]|uniref:GNAT family N-acetyltransferase n=1 Tax=Paenibacillus sp. GCM10027629 TaxID=3273414 RepID=UPI00363A4BD6